MKKIEVMGLQTIPQTSGTDVAKAIEATMRATAYTQGLKERLLLRIASWFISRVLRQCIAYPPFAKNDGELKKLSILVFTSRVLRTSFPSQTNPIFLLFPEPGRSYHICPPYIQTLKLHFG